MKEEAWYYEVKWLNGEARCSSCGRRVEGFYEAVSSVEDWDGSEPIMVFCRRCFHEMIANG